MLAAPGGDSPERIAAAFEWFREEIGRLAAEERRPHRRRADFRDTLP
jgi:hypothetical protein